MSDVLHEVCKRVLTSGDAQPLFSHDMSPTFSSTRSLALACAALAALTLSGCDDRQIDSMLDSLKQTFKAFFDSVKPDTLLLKGLTPGVSTLEQVREQMGKPEKVGS